MVTNLLVGGMDTQLLGTQLAKRCTSTNPLLEADSQTEMTKPNVGLVGPDASGRRQEAAIINPGGP